MACPKGKTKGDDDLVGLNNFFEMFRTCPHLHFDSDVVNRDMLSREQHLQLLATPRGYKWEELSKKNYGRTSVYTNKPKVVCGGRKLKKEEKIYIQNFLAEMWTLFTPDLENRLRGILINELGLSPKEADDFIIEQRALNVKKSSTVGIGTKTWYCPATIPVDFEKRNKIRKPCQKISLGVHHFWVKEFTEVVASSMNAYIMHMLTSKRTKRTQCFSEMILKIMCNITGERCTLKKPKTRLQKLMVFFADRLGVLLGGITCCCDGELKALLRRDEERERRRKEGPSEPPSEPPTPKIEEEEVEKEISEIEKEEEAPPPVEVPEAPPMEEPELKPEEEVKEPEEAVIEEAEVEKPEVLEAEVEEPEVEEAEVEEAKVEEAKVEDVELEKAEVEEVEDEEITEVEEIIEEEEEEEEKEKLLEFVPEDLVEEPPPVEELLPEQEEELITTEEPPSPPPAEPSLFIEEPVEKLDVMKHIVDWMESTTPEETPRQEQLDRVITDRLVTAIEPQDEETEYAIADASKHVSTWVDKLVTGVEKDFGLTETAEERRIGKVFYHIKKDYERDQYKVKQIDSTIACRKVEEGRSVQAKALTGALTKVPKISRGRLRAKDMKKWASWASDVITVTEHWSGWIGKTCADVETAANSQLTAEEWEQWKKETKNRALEWHKNKELLKEAAQMWQRKKRTC